MCSLSFKKLRKNIISHKYHTWKTVFHNFSDLIKTLNACRKTRFNQWIYFWNFSTLSFFTSVSLDCKVLWKTAEQKWESFCDIEAIIYSWWLKYIDWWKQRTSHDSLCTSTTIQLVWPVHSRYESEQQLQDCICRW